MKGLNNYIKEGILSRGNHAQDLKLELARDVFYKSVYEPTVNMTSKIAGMKSMYNNINWNGFKECITLDDTGGMHIDLSEKYPKIHHLYIAKQTKTPQLNIREIKHGFTPASVFEFSITANQFESTDGIFASDCVLDCSLGITSNSYLKDIDGIPQEIHGEFSLVNNPNLYNPYKPRTQEELYAYMESLVDALPEYCQSIVVLYNCLDINPIQRKELNKFYSLYDFKDSHDWYDFKDKWNEDFANEVRDHILCTCRNLKVEFM